ncbi:hypothetical protein C8039_02285 [Halogeometricum sp. wsp3]|nr:hypothetical protein C8039_02285 [Halogeometricum sp. wsp3]
MTIRYTRHGDEFIADNQLPTPTAIKIDVEGRSAMFSMVSTPTLIKAIDRSRREIAVDPETAVDRLLAERTDELQRQWFC